MGYKGGTEEQVSKYLLNRFVCQKESSIRLWQNTPEHGATVGAHTWEGLKDMALPLSLQGEAQSIRIQAETLSTQRQCHLYRDCALGVTPDVCDTTLGNKPTQSLLLHFPGKHFQENVRVVYIAEAQFQRKSCPVKFLGCEPCQKPQDRHSGY